MLAPSVSSLRSPKAGDVVLRHGRSVLVVDTVLFARIVRARDAVLLERRSRTGLATRLAGCRAALVTFEAVVTHLLACFVVGGYAAWGRLGQGECWHSNHCRGCKGHGPSYWSNSLLTPLSEDALHAR